MKKISVIGLGYIGLPTAAMFASHGVSVIGVDVNQRVVDTINSGKIHIVEPDLLETVEAAVKESKLVASTQPEISDAFIIAVPTPFKESLDAQAVREADLRYVKSAAKAIAPVLRPGNLVVLESTSSVGTTQKMIRWLSQARPDLSFPGDKNQSADINIAYCPERVLPGNVMVELVRNDRIIGGMTPDCSSKAVRLYKTFVNGECHVASGPHVAEMAKLTENSFRDVNIAFANELSLICDHLDIDVWELIELTNRHPRVNVLQPGPGVGGHCIAVDPWFIVSSAQEQARIIALARDVNDKKPDWVLGKVDMAIELFREKHSDPYKGVKVACYGIAFKPDIDDFRESPSLYIAERISAMANLELLIVEPNITESQTQSFQDFNFVSFDQAKAQADVHVMLVDHTTFKGSAKPDGLIIDTRGVWK